jgi:hypothetical protein
MNSAPPVSAGVVIINAGAGVLIVSSAKPPRRRVFARTPGRALTAARASDRAVVWAGPRGARSEVLRLPLTVTCAHPGLPCPGADAGTIMIDTARAGQQAGRARSTPSSPPLSPQSPARRNDLGIQHSPAHVKSRSNPENQTIIGSPRSSRDRARGLPGGPPQLDGCSTIRPERLRFRPVPGSMAWVVTMSAQVGFSRTIPADGTSWLGFG